uniref:Methyltransferase type 11 domain-containing protein n=1 Tax=Alexandrium catenella TaxID=2925 RepID=A0A7S1WX45_ALECA
MTRERVAAAGELRGSVSVYQADVFRLADVPEIGEEQFDTASDNAVLHCIGDDQEQERYLAILGQRVRPGGRLLLQALSDQNPDPWVGPPRRLSEERARRLLNEESGWRVLSLRHCLLYSRMGLPGGAGQALFIVAERL